MPIDFEKLKTNGVKVNYLYVCERKLWFFDRGIQLEPDSELVLLGKLLNDSSYEEETRRDILIDDLIRIDILDEDSVREIKRSNKIAQANRMQLLYYLYYLKQLGVEKKGIINYPRLRKKEEVHLTPEAEKEVEEALLKIDRILKLKKPPPKIYKPYCPKCAHYELCWV